MYCWSTHYAGQKKKHKKKKHLVNTYVHIYQALYETNGAVPWKTNQNKCKQAPGKNIVIYMFQK